MNLRFSSIRTRLLILVFLSFLPAMAFLVHSAYVQQRLQRQTALNNASRVISHIGGQFEQLIRSSEQLMVALAKTPETLERGNPRCAMFLSSLVFSNPQYLNIGVADAEGNVHCSATPLKGTTFIGDRIYFKDAVETKKFSFGEFQIGRITGKASLNFGLPIVAADGAIQNVLFVAIDVGWLNNHLSAANLPDQAVMVLFDLNGRILAHSREPEAMVGKPAEAAELVQSGLKRGLDHLEATGPDGVERLYSLVPLKAAGESRIFGYIEIPSPILYSEANEALVRNLALLGVALFLMFSVAWTMGEYMFIRPLKEILKATRKMSRGDLSARVGKIAPAELEEVGRAFNEMAASLETSIKQREETQATLTRRATEYQRSQRELEQINFLASHHLYDPLMRVWGALEMMIRKSKVHTDKTLGRYLEDSIRGVLRMHTVISNLLVYSNEELGLVPTDFNEVLTKVKTDLADKITSSNAQIDASDMPASVTANPEQMIQLLTHLIDNALTHRTLQTPRIDISAKQEGSSWLFAVRDNGIGIDPRHHEGIFEIAERAHTDASFVGTGIGLATCKKIVERHGGKIWLESSFGKGSTFYFSIPLNPPVQIPARKRRRHAESANGHSQAAGM